MKHPKGELCSEDFQSFSVLREGFVQKLEQLWFCLFFLKISTFGKKCIKYSVSF